MNNSLKIALCGIHGQGLEIAEFLGDSGCPVSHFITLSRDRAERNRAAGWVCYRNSAKRLGIPLYEAATYSLKDEADLKFFSEQQFDLIVLGGWQRLLPAAILETLRIGAIGQHGSSEYLPRGRGRSPLNWSVVQGRERLVWNLFLITPGVDDGPIVDTEIFQITPWDDAKTLYYKVGVVVKFMLARTIDRIANGKLELAVQQGVPTYYPSRTPEDGKIDWTGSLLSTHNLIRAVTRPYPGAFTFSRGEKVFIWKAQPFDSFLTVYAGRPPGEVVEVFSEGEFVVACPDGLLLITDAGDYHPTKGDLFEAASGDVGDHRR